MTVTSVHIHLLLNHLPIIGTITGLLLLLGGLVRRSDDVRRAGLVTFVLVALLTVPVYLTGEGAEKAVEGLPGVTEPLIEAHQDAALVAFSASGVLGVLALLALWRSRAGAPLPTTLVNVVLALAVAVSALMVWTGGLGGQIRHTEIRSGETVTPVPSEGR